MKITFNGAVHTVTGSQHLLEVNGKTIMLDCGMFQGKRKESFEKNRSGFCKGESVDCLILSHAHIDHSGRIPCLVRNGFNGDIFCTSATRDLSAVMLLDSAFIQEKDVEYVNRRRSKQGKNLFEPLYTKADVAKAMDQFVGLSYNRPRQLFPGISLTLVDAGHMLGSAHVILDIDEQSSGQKRRLVFSGDIGRADIPIIRDPVPISDGADIVIMESTYGNRLHPAYPESEKELERIVNETVNRGGSLLIPAFAVGRTQQLVYALHKLHSARAIPDLPIFIDSPLATRTTDVFRLHPEVYDAEICEFLLTDDDKNPFGFGRLQYTQSVEQSKALNGLKTPAVIISSGGMLEGGRILHHLRNRIEDPRNTILLTSWQAPNTLGRRLVENEKSVLIYGEEFQVRAKVEVLPGFSGHADRDGLVNFVRVMNKKPHQTFIVHGEQAPSTSLAEALRSELGLENVIIPDAMKTYEV
ncbi:MAG: MBL fold metallo-hydrolase [Desulfuromonadaceae bacterium]|nr:MBL fold metallo-hydrolase [Desulfuromonadaceae bacterium]MDD2848046.1 MBL fold metallo-hydrolase [Desulfuromonadaceae bacterium]MDD4132113.1 MBL fold metallo-hydrolase [Desulfuromonadaceae bacterium]